MGILFIDLTEVGGVGQGAHEALEKRAGQGQLLHLKLEKEAMAFRDTKTTPNFQLGHLTEPVDEIIIGAHGILDDTDYCYSDDPIGSTAAELGEVKLLSAHQLADFCQAVFQSLNLPNSQPLEIVLAVCYAARTSEYRRNHIEAAQHVDFRQSFSYRFAERFRLISTVTIDLKANLRAYLGAVCFNEQTGELMGESEAKINNGFKVAELRHEMVRLTEILDRLERDGQNVANPLYMELDGRVDQLQAEIVALSKSTMMQQAGEVIYFARRTGVEFDLEGFVAANTRLLYNQQTPYNHSKCVCFSLGIEQFDMALPRKRGLKC